MKMKKLIYILLIIVLFPASALAAEEYPYLPTFLKEEVIDVFDINTAGKTMLYERVNIYDDFDAWMIGWFDEECKIITGITDTEDIIYYNMSLFNEIPQNNEARPISPEMGEEAAREFMQKIMPRTALKLVSANAYEYTFSQTHNGIRLLGRDATVVVDKLSGQVVYYKGFGLTDSKFELMERLVTPEHAFESYYQNIGMELVYNTVFDHEARMKTVRPMYILNRSSLAAVDAQTGKAENIVMHDYNYYYNDSYYDSRYYHDNNIYTEEKVFTEDGRVSASGYDVNELMKQPYLALSDDYSTKITPGILSYYMNGSGSSNTVPVLRIDIVPMKHAVNVLKFAEMFDDGNVEWLHTAECETPFVFARAYVDAENGRLLDYETVKNRTYISNLRPYYAQAWVDGFIDNVAGDLSLKHYGTLPAGDIEYTVTYARYADGIRVIGEGASVIYDASLRAVVDYSLIVTGGEFMPVSFMKTPEEIKEAVKNELSLELFYADKDENTKFVIYDAADKNIAFDPFTGTRIDRLKSNAGSFIGVCEVGSEEYVLNGTSVSAPSPVISSGKLCLPLNTISEMLGYEITVNESEILLSNEKDVMNLSLDSADCMINGQSIGLDQPPVNVSENIYISAGVLRTLFGMFVSWDIKTSKIHLIR